MWAFVLRILFLIRTYGIIVFEVIMVLREIIIRWSKSKPDDDRK